MENNKCSKHRCFANKNGICACLENTHFKKRECPFFKSKIDHDKDVQKYGGQYYGN